MFRVSFRFYNFILDFSLDSFFFGWGLFFGARVFIIAHNSNVKPIRQQADCIRLCVKPIINGTSITLVNPFQTSTTTTATTTLPFENWNIYISRVETSFVFFDFSNSLFKSYQLLQSIESIGLTIYQLMLVGKTTLSSMTSTTPQSSLTAQN